MVSQEQVISLIREYVFDEELPRYTFANAKSQVFRKKSYLLWAADELMCLLLKRRTESPIRVIEDFKNKTLLFSKIGSINAKSAFAIAYDLAVNILDVCQAAGWTKN